MPVYKKPPIKRSGSSAGDFDGDQAPFDPGNDGQLERTRRLSENAGGLIGDMNDLLDEPESDSSSEQGGGESGGGFYRGSGDDNDNSSESAASGSSKEPKNFNPTQLGNAESEAKPGLAGESDGGLYNPAAALGGGWFANLSGRRKSAFGFILSIAVGGGIFGAGFFAEPAQAIHYGQMLANITPFQHQEESGESRLTRMIRAARAGDVSEMRLGTLGSKMNAHIQAKFAENGIKFKTNGLTGRFIGIEVDASKQSKYSSLDSDKVAAQFASDNGIKASVVTYDAKTRIITADITGTTLSERTSIVTSYAADNRFGKLGVFNDMRITKKVLNLPSKWLSPLDYLKTTGDEKVSNFATKVAANSDRLKSIQEKSADVKAFNAELRGKINPSALTAVAGVAVGTLLVCSAKDIAQSIPQANRLNIVVPAVVSGADAVGASANAMYDIATGNNSGLLDDLHVLSDSFKGKDGSSPFQGQSIQAIEGNTTTANQSPEDPTISQAFQPTQGANELNQTLDQAGAGALCSPVSQIAQGVVGVGLLLLGPGGVVTKLVETATTLATMKAISAGTDAIKKIVTDDAVLPAPHQGKAGGNVDGLGTIELANITARANGGANLTGSELTQLDNRGLNQDFTSQSFASRILNPLDSRSLVAKAIDSQSLSGTQNIASMASFAVNGLSTLGSTLSNVASIFSPKAKADASPSTPYNLGIPESGIPLNILNDPRFADPFDNADKVGQNVLDPELSGDTASGDYASRAKTCFGITFNKGSDGWSAVATDDVNPYTSDYESANCTDTGDENWIRLRLFLFDTGTMNSYACSEMDDGQSCKDLGYDSSSSDTAGTQPTTGGPVTPSGTAAEIATRILAVKAAGGISFEHPADLSDITLTAAGQGISNANTCEPTVYLDPYMLQTMLSLTVKFNMRISAIVSGHGPCDSYRLHGLGRAFDVGAVTELSTGQSSELDATATNSVDLDFINAAAAALPKGGDVGQVNQPGRSAVTLPPGVNGINDVPNHQHIDVGPPPGN